MRSVQEAFAVLPQVGRFGTFLVFQAHTQAAHAGHTAAGLRLGPAPGAVELVDALKACAVPAVLGLKVMLQARLATERLCRLRPVPLVRLELLGL